MAKQELLKPRLLESIDRLKKFVELDAPAPIVGAAAWATFQLTLAMYGPKAAHTMVRTMRNSELQQRGVCSHGDCTAAVERPGMGICGKCAGEVLGRVFDEPLIDGPEAA